VRGLEIPKTVADLLTQISALDGLSVKGKTQTATYRKGKPFLHFHWNNDEIMADVRYSDDWERVPANSAAERRQLVDDVRSFLAK
jgi:hypothetical protein